ncbi:unnamed protein product [Urochloa humidicola]
MSTASSDPPVDLEKDDIKAAATKDDEEPANKVDPRVAMCVTVALNVFTVLYVLFVIGLITWMVVMSKNWWDPWPALTLLPMVAFTIKLTPKLKFATKPTPGSDDSDLSAKLLALKE